MIERENQQGKQTLCRKLNGIDIFVLFAKRMKEESTAAHVGSALQRWLTEFNTIKARHKVSHELVTHSHLRTFCQQQHCLPCVFFLSKGNSRNDDVWRQSTLGWHLFVKIMLRTNTNETNSVRRKTHHALCFACEHHWCACVCIAAQPPTLLGTTEKKFALERQAAQSISVFIHHRRERKIIFAQWTMWSTVSLVILHLPCWKCLAAQQGI